MHFQIVANVRLFFSYFCKHLLKFHRNRFPQARKQQAAEPASRALFSWPLRIARLRSTHPSHLHPRSAATSYTMRIRALRVLGPDLRANKFAKCCPSLPSIVKHFTFAKCCQTFVKQMLVKSARFWLHRHHLLKKNLLQRYVHFVYYFRSTK